MLTPVEPSDEPNPVLADWPPAAVSVEAMSLLVEGVIMTVSVVTPCVTVESVLPAPLAAAPAAQ